MQVRVTGVVEKLSFEESTIVFEKYGHEIV
jgi:hypothetical protein